MKLLKTTRNISVTIETDRGRFMVYPRQPGFHEILKWSDDAWDFSFVGVDKLDDEDVQLLHDAADEVFKASNRVSKK